MQKEFVSEICGIVKRTLASTWLALCSILTMGLIKSGKPSLKACEVNFMDESVANCEII